jgi:hypothetical protein
MSHSDRTATQSMPAYAAGFAACAKAGTGVIANLDPRGGS